MKHNCLFFALVVTPLIFVGRSALAQSDEYLSTTGDQKVVMMASDLEEETIAPVFDAVRAQLSDIDVKFEVVWFEDTNINLSVFEREAKWLAEVDKTVVVFWCDLRREDSTGLFMSVADLDRTLVRRLGGVKEGGISETIGIIVRSSVDAILRGVTSKMYKDWEEPEKELDTSTTTEPRSATDDEIPRAKPELEPKKEKRHFISAAYAFEMQNRNFGPASGVAADLSLQFWDGWHVFLGYAFFPDAGGSNLTVFDDADGDGENDIDGHARLERRRNMMTIGGRYRGVFDRWELGFSLAFGLDFVDEEIFTTSDSDLLQRDLGANQEFAIIPSLELGFRIFSEMRLLLIVSANVNTKNTSYTVLYDRDGDDGTAELEADSLWPVRPAARIGLSWGLF